MSDFSERFKNHSNLELIKIIENPNDYQAIAVETAKKILISRQVSQEEIETAKEEIARQNHQNNLQTEKKKVIENKVKNFSASVVDTINPIQATTPTSNKNILIVSVVLSVIFLKNLYNEFGMLSFMLTDDEANWDFSVFIYIFPIVLLPLGIFFFWRREEIGWWALSIYFTFNAISVITSMAMQLNYEPSGYSMLDNLFPHTSILTYIWHLIFNVGLLWVICKDNVKSIYNIDKKKMFTSFGIAVALAIFLMTGVFM